jgi:hypothetical protein
LQFCEYPLHCCITGQAGSAASARFVAHLSQVGGRVCPVVAAYRSLSLLKPPVSLKTMMRLQIYEYRRSQLGGAEQRREGPVAICQA